MRATNEDSETEGFLGSLVTKKFTMKEGEKSNLK